MIFYFSGTGNSKWVAHELSLKLNETLVFIPDALSGTLEFSLREDEKIGFVFPIYSWAPPEIVMRFIREMKLEGYKQQYLFFVCSCGDDTGLTQQLLTRALKVRGWECNAGFSVTMPNNYVLLPGFDVDSDEVANKKLAVAAERVQQIGCSIEKRDLVFSCHEGSFPFIKTRIINPLFSRFPISTRRFYSTDDCISCKRCEKNCPVGNVKMQQGRPLWGDNCTSCLACIHICPVQAVQYGKITKKKGRYFNPNLTSPL